MWKIHFSSYAMLKTVVSFLAFIYIVHERILKEALSDIVQYLLLHFHPQT